MGKIRVLIVDDEEPARVQINELLKDRSEIEVVGQCENAFEAVKAIQTLKPGLMFLDIQMPRISGIEMLDMIDDPPYIIFSTAFNEYAVKAFELNAVDYLLKPYTRRRFNEALDRALDLMKMKEGQKKDYAQLQENLEDEKQEISRIVVKKSGSMHVLPVQDIICLEAKGDYVQIQTAEGNFMKQKTLRYFAKQLPANSFCRVHRSYIVNLEKVKKIESWGKETWIALLEADRKALVSKSGMALLKDGLGM